MLRRILVTAVITASFLGGAELGKYTPAERRHWAFQKRSHPEVPAFTAPADKAWVRNPIDAFILARLQKEGLKPSARADKSTLLRRVYFDLTGLPPTPAQAAKFLADKSPDAYTKVVDELLASSGYGERWGQHWLDVVRFAESDGFEYDTHRPDAWRYRDYVIQSFNSDKPYDEFIREQLAGDEINPKNEVMRIAAGFQRLGGLRKNGGNQDAAFNRNEELVEMTNVIGSAFLGVTLGCARCHDHKFDPIRHTDYYRMQAFFAATHENDVPLSTPAEQAAWKEKNDAAEVPVKALKATMKGLTGDALEVVQKKVDELEAKGPPPLPVLFSVADDPEKVSPVYVLARGDTQNRGPQVGMRPLGILLPDGSPELPADTKAPREVLANWILDPQNPLPARVMANRIWQYHFGRGIVATPNDFGRMGTRPSHPELLDYLANQLIEGGWKFKAMHRMILLSSTYQQSSQTPTVEKDPDNALLWKFSRRRLEAEEIRDSALAIAGKLNPKQGGPSVIIPIDPDLLNVMYKPAQWAVTADKEEHNRRSIYLFAKRNFKLPFMDVFDAPDRQISCARRESSTHPPQALELLNGDTSNRMANALAERLLREAGKDKAKEVDFAYRLGTGRLPTRKEKQIAVAFLQKEPLREFALALFNLNSFLYVD
ncbi:MAG: DUF1549 and DUF1553 domain-containing protein [Bryobacteraceae bacterium]